MSHESDFLLSCMWFLTSQFILIVMSSFLCNYFLPHHWKLSHEVFGAFMTSSKRQGQKINSAFELFILPFVVPLLIIYREYFYDIAIKCWAETILNRFFLLLVDMRSYADDCIFWCNYGKNVSTKYEDVWPFSKCESPRVIHREN